MGKFLNFPESVAYDSRIRCFILANDTYEGRFKIGGMTSANLDRWTGPFANGLLTVFVTADDCSIVSQVFIGGNGDNTSKSVVNVMPFTDFGHTCISLGKYCLIIFFVPAYS